jgi:NAD(P)-dependent dehydrogenase (short-subunit alcohol dehydrogenase family)
MAPCPTVLVVGCSDGIGLALVRRLLGRGASVIGVSRRESPVADPRYQHHSMDAADSAYGAQLAALVGRFTDLEACVYSAGIGHPFDAEQIEHDERVFEVNLLGAVRTAKAVLPGMLARGRGRLVVLSSQADRLVGGDGASYSASKAGLSSYFEAVGLALRSRGIRVCNVRFGFVDTKMARSPVRPFMISADAAAARIERVLFGRCPLRLTYPLRMAMVVALVGWIGRWRVRWASLAQPIR